MSAYPAIEDHGLIGDLQTAALIDSDGSVDWFCSPRFDSPSLFASLLDRERGGRFRIAPESGDYVSRQLYLPGTAILITRFMTPDGVGEVADFMPVAGAAASQRHRIVRLVRVVRGQMRFAIHCEPAFDYGRRDHKTEVTENGVAFHGDAMSVNLSIVRDHDVPPREGAELRVDERGGVHAVVTASAGEAGGVVLETAPDGPPRLWSPDEALRLLTDTRDFWRGWIGRSHYRGRWREMVERSAMTLKLMTYAPTGALVAAPTAGLPELVGGERNWDYRFTWVRDASFSVHALLGLGFEEEAEAFLVWLGDRAREAVEQGSPLQIMYRIDGTGDLSEESLEHLEGYRESRPVRIGNGAATQVQLDIYGEALDSVYLADGHGLPVGYQGWTDLSRIVDWLCGHWDQKDAGLWETRGGPKDFVYGRLMSWVALDRAIRLARERGRPADLVRWTEARDAIYQQIMRRGWSAERGAFIQHYGGDVLDASLLYMPLVGFIAPRDPRWQSTLRAMDDELVSDSLVYRYDPGASPDGLRGSEGTFSMCTFWYVEALARSGRLNDARLTFEKMLTYSNRLGLYSEEIGPTGEQLGNFPQAFSHLALITAAVNLDRRLDR
ncbi:glycoside hydrolase family 15 protein [Actinomadura barringtoniae]|uniref:Glycoside hydrolase family 15 protein n=1 Tax=Actinomadura barringtoniae TaxID=1427535 RepID=A0A939T5S1_9ACTN|nr:glycoside hydrolase family 15 protein [Actinomadura barringtoniae]MBO2447442.1 glycoside hydrolase family 15 protein [Actinomadura barringtoniae]